MIQQTGTPRRPSVAIVLYPGHTNIDVVGPQTVLALDMDVHLVWKTLDPVLGDTGMGLVPSVTFADCPRDVDVLMVPGGWGTKDVIVDVEVLEWLVDMASRARYVTSVCTGSVVLGVAGLLDGYRAATHWTTREMLPLFGAENVNERVVVDRNRITGGGATAGMDFGLTLLAEMLGEERAQISQLMLEYDPQPPFDAGIPERAPREVVEHVQRFVAAPNATIINNAHLMADQGWGTARGSNIAG